MVTKKRITAPDGVVTVSGKRANGMGSLYYDEKRERWVATFADPTTKKRRKVLGRTQDDAETRRTERIKELEAARAVSILGSDPTFRAYAELWLEVDAPSEARPNTLRSYKQDIRRLNVELGDLPLSTLTPKNTKAAMAKIRASYGYGTSKNARARLRQILDEAVADDLGR